MTTKKTENSTSNSNNDILHAVATKKNDDDIGTAEKSPSSSLKHLLKEALANKDKKSALPTSSKKTDKALKIGMPPRGTRRSMGKR